jgi:quinoprotein relay system zinc metallohydrolase 2
VPFHRSSNTAALLGWLSLVALSAHAAVVASLPPLALDNPAPGIYVHFGRQEPMSRENSGDIANLGFIVGNRCVAVVDTGGTYAVGRALRDAIRSVTTLPICYVINTHVHPDHVFGNAAFIDDHPQFIGHARLPAALARRGSNYLNALRRDLGDRAEGTAIVAPTETVEAGETLDLGARRLRLRAWRTAHTDCDLTVYDEATRTLFVGDLAFIGHIPVVDGNLRGFLKAIEELRTIAADRAIAGHGRAVTWPDALAPEARYLTALLSDVRAAIKAGRSLTETVESIQPPPGAWLLRDEFHRRNVSAAYAELEWDP